MQPVLLVEVQNRTAFLYMSHEAVDLFHGPTLFLHRFTHI